MALRSCALLSLAFFRTTSGPFISSSEVLLSPLEEAASTDVLVLDEVALSVCDSSACPFSEDCAGFSP